MAFTLREQHGVKIEGKKGKTDKKTPLLAQAHQKENKTEKKLYTCTCLK